MTAVRLACRSGRDRASRPGPEAGRRAASLRVLFLVSAHNSLSQRAWIALTELGHEVTVAVVDSAAAMEAAVGEHRPAADRVPDAQDDDPRVDLGDSIAA